ncbi:MAG: lipid-A-disaccharide synthase [Chryseolinea sp.]
MKYYLVAGERSGDLHAGNLVHELRALDPSGEFRGFGGDHMKSEGVVLTVHYVDLAFMGFVEVVTNLNKINKYIRLCRSDIEGFQPDIIILIDYGGFNAQIARFAKRKKFRVDYYIPPKYWAWWEGRARGLKRHVDNLYVILPFEKEFFKKFNWNAQYVGNPVLDAVKAHDPDPAFLEKFKLTKPFVALLPGSRKQELSRILPLLLEVTKRFSGRHFAIAAVSNLPPSMYEEIGKQPNVTLVFEDTYNLLTHASAAIVTSGTATLETALFRVPQIVVYKANAVSYFLGKLLVRVPFISLVNLIAGREVVKEMLQSAANPQSVSQELEKILVNASYRELMLEGYGDIIKQLDNGSASKNTARLMFEATKSVSVTDRALS